MDRRLLLAALAAGTAARALAQDGAPPRPRHKISAAELHEALSKKFPLRFGPPGLLEVEVTAPGLLLLPSRNKLGAALQARASGQGLRRVETGEVDLVFALRYEPSDQSLRASEAEVLDVRLPGLSTEGAQMFRSLLPRMMRDAMGEVTLHRFSAQDLALTDTMGFEPEQLTVVEDGLVVVFGPKGRR